MNEILKILIACHKCGSIVRCPIPLTQKSEGILDLSCNSCNFVVAGLTWDAPRPTQEDL